MDKDQLTLECYKVFADSKERFIDRSFNTNKFYLATEIALLLAIEFWSIPHMNPATTAILAIVGMFVSALWWFNHDSYEYLIRIKYKDVLEKLEAEMGVAPFTMESKAHEENEKKKKAFVFSNAHKFISLFVFLAFLIFFISALTPAFIKVLTAGVY